MEDSQIVALYWERSQDAIVNTQAKYGKLCFGVAFNILHSESDSEECVNDTWYRAWITMPPQRPNALAPFLCKITRNLSLDRLKMQKAQKRGGGQWDIALAELEECLPSTNTVVKTVEDKELTELLNVFLKELTPVNRRVFLRRYWYLSSVKDIAKEMGCSEGKVKMMLHRTRKQLQQYLQKEGVQL